jgi:hypothetical protein
MRCLPWDIKKASRWFEQCHRHRVPILPDKQHSVLRIDSDDRYCAEMLLNVPNHMAPGDLDSVRADRPDPSSESPNRFQDGPRFHRVGDIA